jgi:site-specific DNA recombinase
MFEWVAGEHIGIHLIAARLNSLGVPTRRDRGKWYRSVVSDLLRNRSYVGEMVCNRKDTRGIGAIRRLPKDKRRPLSAKERPPEQWVTVAIPPLIERGLFDRVQTALQTTTKRGGRRDTGLLSMIAKCGLCGATMGYARHTQQGRYYIRCNRRYANHFDVKMPPPKCPNPHHRAERLEQAVWDRLWAILFEPGRLERELERTSKVSPATETLTALAQELKDLDGQIAEKHREQALTIQKQLKELVTEAVADAILLDVKGALVALETRRRDVSSRLADLRAAMTPDAAAGARELAALVQEKREIYETWAKTAPFDERREFVLKAVTKVIIEPSGDFDFRYA